MSELSAITLGVRTLTALLCAGTLIGLAAGCPFTNTAHCGYKGNGADNPCPEGHVCSVCAAANNGCVPLDQIGSINESCLDTTAGQTTAPGTDSGTVTMPTGTTVSTTSSTTMPVTVTETATETATDTATDTDTSSSSSSSSTTTIPADCDPANGPLDEDCEQYCVALGQCGPCSQLDGITCAEIDPAKPACDPSGVCTECTALDTMACSDAEPACDPDTGTCTKCTEHNECPETACDIETGACFPPENVYFVGNLNVCVNGTGLTEDDPFCTFGLVPLMPGVPTTIKILPGGLSPGTLSIPDNHIVAIVRHGAQTPEIDGSQNAFPTISVTGAGSRLYLSKLNFRNGPGVVLRCQAAATLYAYDVAVLSNTLDEAMALSGFNCKIRVRRARIDKCGAGIQVTGGDLRVESSFIFENGVKGNFGAFQLINNAVAHITYSTVLLNAHTPSVFTCTGNGQTVTVRNSAVLGVAPLSEGACDITQDGGMLEEPADGIAEGALVTEWFTPAGGVYPPKSDPDMPDPLEGQAMWGAGDPRLDFKSVPIPQGVPTFAGAQQPPDL